MTAVARPAMREGFCLVRGVRPPVPSGRRGGTWGSARGAAEEPRIPARTRSTRTVAFVIAAAIVTSPANILR